MIDNVQRPVTCFITFEYEVGKLRAMEYNRIAEDIPEFCHFKELLGEPIHIEQAPEPSDIIWENRQYSNQQRTTRSQIAFAIIVVILAITFAFIYVAQNRKQRLHDKYPFHNCEKIER